MARKPTYADLDPNWPICSTPGCDRKCANHGGGVPKRFCSKCHNSLTKGTYDKPMVCSNKDERLGFKCPIDYEALLPQIGQGVLTEKVIKHTIHCDHINGRRDGENSSDGNIQWICTFCHAIKTSLEGDNKGFKYT